MFVLLLACGIGLVTLGLGVVATGTAGSRDAALEEPPAALTPRQTVIEPFCGIEFARGLANYNSSDMDKIKGLHTNKIEQVLGYKPYEVTIHRDNLALL